MTNILSNFHFIRPGWLLLIPVVVGLWWLWQRRSDPLRGWRAQIEPELLEALVVGRESTRRGPIVWLLIAWVIATIAIAGPTWRLEPNPFVDDATPLMILLKADVSMDTPDPAPSRLERAHLKIVDLAAARKGQPLGLIAYADSAHLVLPPTRDTAIVAQMAAEISPAIMPAPGDRLDLALKEAVRILTDGGQGGSILILADSVETDLSALQSLKIPLPVQCLAISSAESKQNESLLAAAKAIKAPVEQLSVQDDDIAAIIRRAARTPIAQQGERGGQWQEFGYWLLPFVAIIVAMSFRREEQKEVGA
jgi:Ca-activated chloride channel family protein